ncbi:hypothetical protein HPB51_029244 [Rhipicephalus microplus]|uniref:Uncharacterized protein n=1 Tax=Rhipicephalus microplus TaxID=6941 RepID=A0A9J6CUQ2_RHIMP|nr:hypothetical protein HPB51_029244 [Rhipicephalus microplus]
MDIEKSTSEQCNLVLDADFRICDAAASLTLAARTTPAAGRNAALRSGVMEDKTTMEHSQDQGEDHQTDPVHVVRRHVSPQTIILRLGIKLHVAKYPTYQVTNAIGVAAGLTASEVRGVCIQVRKLQNLVAATSGRESAAQKLAGLRSLTLIGERHDVTAYVATEAQLARCVVHGLPKNIPNDQLLSIITIEDRQNLAARRIGNSETILLTVKGATVPKEVKMGLWLTKTQPFRPRAVQCIISLTIGHRADACPTAHEFTSCETRDQQFLPLNNPGVQRMNVKLSASTARDRMGHGVPRNSWPTTSPASPRKNTTKDHTYGLYGASEEPGKPESTKQTSQEVRPELSFTAAPEPVFSFARFHTGPTT